MSEQYQHTFTVTLETNEPVDRDTAKACLMAMLERGKRKGAAPQIVAAEKRDA